MKIVDTQEAKTHFSQLLDSAVKGEQIIIARAGKPMARLVSCHRESRELGARKGGHWKGLVRVDEDFDGPQQGDS